MVIAETTTRDEELERLQQELDRLHAQGRDAYVAECKIRSTNETYQWVTSDVTKKLKRRAKKYIEHPTTHDPQVIKIDDV